MPRPPAKSAGKRTARTSTSKGAPRGAAKSGLRKPRATGDKPPFRKSSDKPSFGKSSTTRRPAFGKSSDKPSFGKPRFGAKRDDEKPSFGAKREGSRPSFGAKREGGRPSFGTKREGGRPSFGAKREGGRPSFGAKREGGRPSFGAKREGGRPSFGARDGARPSFRKSTPRAKSESSEPMTLKVGGASKEIAAAPKSKSFESAPKPDMTLKLSSKEAKSATTAPRKKSYERIPKEVTERALAPRKRSFGNDAKSFDRKPKFSRDGDDKPSFASKPLTIKPKRVAKERVAKEGPKKKQADTPGTTRLNKFIASAGVASRRKADELITSGAVAINGKVVTELGTKVHPHEDRITVSGEIVSIPHKFLYLLLNKPKDTITTTSDERDRSTVLDYVKTEERVYPVGRLDRNTTGVLLLTNDGELTNALTHPSHEIEREYHVTLDKSLEADDARKIADGGVNIGEGDITGPAGLSLDPKNRKDVILTLREGKNREVRRLFETLGYDVQKLDRIRFASLTHRGMKRGDVRPLTNSEVHALKRMAGLEKD